MVNFKNSPLMADFFAFKCENLDLISYIYYI